MFKMKDRNIWNEYTDEYIAQTKPETNTPVLMMNGTLDPQTALEIALPSKEFLNKENHYFITFPETPHGVTSTSITNEMLSNHFGGTTCGEKIMFEFIKNPLQKPSEACLSDIALLSWGDTGMNRGMAYQFMNTTDMWDGDQTGKKSLEDSKFSKAITESLERTRRTYINSPEFIKLMKRIK